MAEHQYSAGRNLNLGEQERGKSRHGLACINLLGDTKFSLLPLRGYEEMDLKNHQYFIFPYADSL
jgi:hypothetical protein